MGEPVNVGVVGCGAISAQYLRTLERVGREPRAGGSLALHVLDVMESLLASARSGAAVTVTSTCERPRPVALTALGE